MKNTTTASDRRSRHTKLQSRVAGAFYVPRQEYINKSRIFVEKTVIVES